MKNRTHLADRIDMWADDDESSSTISQAPIRRGAWSSPQEAYTGDERPVGQRVSGTTLSLR
jgi:hypothetical protein